MQRGAFCTAFSSPVEVNEFEGLWIVPYKRPTMSGFLSPAAESSTDGHDNFASSTPEPWAGFCQLHDPCGSETPDTGQSNHLNIFLPH